MKKRNLFYKHFLFARLSLVANHMRYFELSRFFMMIFGVFQLGCSSLLGKEADPMSPASAEFTFEQYEVVTGAAKHQTVLTGFLLGDTTAELVVVNIDETGSRRLHIYAFDNDSWALKLEATLRPEVLFVDVANIGGRDRLITYEEGRLNWFDPESATAHPLMTVTSNAPPPIDVIPHLDVTQDLNGDNCDDLVVPDSDGFWVFIQMDNGTFADPVKIGSSIEIGRIYAVDGYRYNPWTEARIHEMDYDQDGRSDLVFWNEDHFVVHYQDERGLSSPVAKTFTTEVTFDSDDLDSLVAPEGVRGRRFDHGAPGAMTGRVLHRLTDMNADGIADLSIFSLQAGKSGFLGQTSELWNMHSSYEVHFGRQTPGGTVFGKEVGTMIRSDGIPFEIGARDFDHDGQTDVMFAIIDPGIFKIIGMLARGIATHSTLLDLNLYRMEEGSYPDERNATYKIKAYTPGDSGRKAMHFPSLLFGDVNGDGRPDMLVQNGSKELYVFIGVPGPDLFARKPQKVAVVMPYEEYTQLVDFNKDGMQDLLMHHPSTTEPHRVTMLIAQ
jgi:hypothetical protein